ncbi:TetR/AcrR family transcriptional regulator [Saccharothrix sp. Mg75]|uniref:TetR/AcrR family transcriptional regulator n=1 Tax=Saccharothrix sp. Mg75 TaxID=3445357 RepID=UPI003EED1E49
MQRTSADTREHVLRVAHGLFHGNGIRVTGVDKVAAAAGVAPTTLYRLFADKDDLVAAYVARADELTRAWFADAVRSAGPDPRERVLAVFDALTDDIQSDARRGCAFLMALAEFPDPASPVHVRAVAAKEWMRTRIGELVGALGGVDDPDVLADHLVLVVEGVNASSQALGPTGPSRQARALAEALLPPR